MEWGEVMAEPKKLGTDRAEEVWRAWCEMMELVVPGAEMQLPDLGEALGREMAQVARAQAERTQAGEVENAARAANAEETEILVVRAAEKAGVADVSASVAARADSDVADDVGGGQVRRDDVALAADGKGAVAGAVSVDIAGGGVVSAQAVADVPLAGGVPGINRSVGSVRQWRAVPDIYGGAAGPLFVVGGENGGQGNRFAERDVRGAGWLPGGVMDDGGGSGTIGGVSADLVEEVCDRVVERLARALEVYVQSR